MAYVITETQMNFVRSEKDFGGFERSYFKRVERIVDMFEAPKEYKTMKDDHGKNFTAVLHAKTKEVIDVIL